MENQWCTCIVLMPPANVKKQDKAQQKALEKQKQKIAEDKTFGLKNKNKSKSVQKFIKSVQNSVKGNQNVSEQKLVAAEKQKKDEMKKQAREAAFLSSLFKSVESAKKDKLKAQNPEVLKAEQKIDIYTDQRDQNKGDSMLYWDQAKLEAVIQEKDGQSRANPTEIVCKYFIEALEKRQYGWFWKCPNGGSSCKYRHCLPQGYVLKTVEPDSAKAEEEESLETILERERASLPANGTKVTLETFLAWKKRKQEAKKQEIEEAVRGKKTLSGKDLFTFDKSLFVDDAAAASEDDYVEEEGYWDSVINENQAKLDEANTQAKLDEASTQADAIKKTDVEVPVC